MSLFFKHLKTGNLYELVGIARSVKNPNRGHVVYKQLYESKLRNTEEVLPIGSLWIRKEKDFNKKFESVNLSKIGDIA